MSNTNQAIEKASKEIESALSECGVDVIGKLPTFMQAVRMAQGISALRAALSDHFVQTVLMPLQGSKLGFLTDKDKDGGYGLNIVRDCCIEAMLRGFYVVGNEFNIIAGGFYGARAGWERKVAEYPGLTDLVHQPGVPQLAGDKGALVPYVATWCFNGKPMSLRCIQEQGGPDLRIPVKVNAGMGADAILGKAARKVAFRIYQRINGSTLGAGEGEVGEDPLLTTGEPAPSAVPEGTPEGRRISLGKRSPPKASEPAPAPVAAQPQARAANDATPIASPEDDGRIT
ncbi:MAG: hypothetical protein RL685_4603 [Pseudomonadota bacterium]|jgi:hypothetical protein